MTNRYFAGLAALLAGVSSAAMVVVPAAASAQSEPGGYDQDGPSPAAYQSPPPQYQSPPPGFAPQYQPPPAQYQPSPQYASSPPPQGQYAPPSSPANEAEYNNWLYRQALRDYHARYAQWYAENSQNAASQGPAAESCSSQRNTNVAAGAIFGGVAGALMGASLAGWAVRGAWALFGGSVGLTAGAMLGASATPPGCEHRYAAGTQYYEAGPAYARPYSSGWYGARGYGGYGYYPAPPRYIRRPAYPGYGPPPSPYNY